MKKTIHLLLLTITTLFVLPAFAEEYTLDDEYAARHCVSEASGARTNDCRVVVWIDKQRAERRGLSVSAWIGSHHFRHVRSTSRPYLAYLNRTMEYPAGWPNGIEDWEQRGKPAWRRTLDVAHRVNTGELSHQCAETPLDWGGRLTDCVNLQERLRGDWHEADCGTTVNMFLARGHQEPVPDLRCEERLAELRARQEARRAAAAGGR